jgi:gas vesicle protein
MFERKRPFTGFLVTFGAGMLTGAAVALLYTPITGKRMQKKVADVSEKIVDTFEDLQEKVRKVATA